VDPKGYGFPKLVPVFILKDAPDTVLARYPTNPKAGYRLTGKVGYQISVLITTGIF
jgi:hypothetical protein